MKGTCSTTNYFVLQSFLKFDEVINLYGYFPEKQKYKVFNEEGIDVFPSAKIVEKKVLKDFKEKYVVKNEKPILVFSSPKNLLKIFLFWLNICFHYL